MLSSSQIVDDLKLPCTSRTFRNVLSKNPNAKFSKMKVQPPLTKNHEKERLKFAKDHITFGDKWQDVVFSDEKKFNLDGPDGFRYYWHDIRKESSYFSKRQFSGGSVMIWGGFAANGTTPIAYVKAKSNSEDYQDILAEKLLPEAPLITSGEYIFQQDNASIHNSSSTKSWFEANNVKVLKWPSRSPDLNPTENLWGILVREIYGNGKFYNTKEELKMAIETSWKNLPKDTLKCLSTSMTSRMIKLIEKKGNFLDY